jgi:pyruvate/2-oxoglutarate dehydrogenase complex dihydrolipoamide dehydrogenase (E3) component
MQGREKEIRHCVACYEGCGMVSDQEGVCCIHNPAAGREERLGIGTLKKTDSQKNIMVVGAGVAGLKIAEIAAKRGHRVRVFEKAGCAGGQMLLAEKIPYRAEQNEVYRYLEVELQALGVPVRFDCEVDKAMVDREDPDCVIVATGSHPTLPNLDVGAITVLDPRQAMTQLDRIGKKVVLVDRIGYWQAMGVADYISEIGADVSIVTDRLFVGVDIVETCRENLNRRLAGKGVRSYTSMRLKDVRDGDVVLENIFNFEETVLKGVDTLIFAQESRSDDELYREIKREGRREVHVLGDAAAPGTVLRIVFDAEELGRRI